MEFAEMKYFIWRLIYHNRRCQISEWFNGCEHVASWFLQGLIYHRRCCVLINSLWLNVSPTVISFVLYQSYSHQRALNTLICRKTGNHLVFLLIFSKQEFLHSIKKKKKRWRRRRRRNSKWFQCIARFILVRIEQVSIDKKKHFVTWKAVNQHNAETN